MDRATPDLEQSRLTARRLAKQLGLRLIRAYRFLRQREQNSLTLSQAAVLDLLGDDRQWRIGDLAEAAGIRQPSMTDLLNRMEHQGWVRKVQALHDKRGVEVTMTEEGRTLLRAINRRHVDNMAQRIALLSDEDKAVIERALPIFDFLFGAPETTRPE